LYGIQGIELALFKSYFTTTNISQRDISKENILNTIKYHVFAPMGRFQLNQFTTGQKHKYNSWDDGGK
jgi:hypothetical protein